MEPCNTGISRKGFDVLIKNILIDKFVKTGFFLLVLSYHILPVAHVFLGEIQFLGKNIIIVIPVLFVCFSLLFLFRHLSPKGFLLASTLIFAYFFLTTISILFYDSDISAFLGRRFYLVPIFMAFLVFKILALYEYRSFILRIFLLTIIIQCGFGIIHNVFFPEVLYVSSDFGYGYFEDFSQYGEYKTREAGTMVSASCYAYVLLSGMMVLAYIKELPWGISHYLLRLGMQLYFFVGILLSGSRGPIILAILSVVSMVFSKQSPIKNISIRSIILILSVTAGIYFGFDESIKASVIDRTVDGGTGGRYEKLLLVFSVLSQNIYFLVGAPLYIQATSEINGFMFSDNSFGTLLLVFGLAGLLPIAIIFYMMARVSRKTRTVLPVFIGLVCLSTTNSILWEPWIFYYLVAIMLILFSKKIDIENNIDCYSLCKRAIC